MRWRAMVKGIERAKLDFKNEWVELVGGKPKVNSDSKSEVMNSQEYMDVFDKGYALDIDVWPYNIYWPYQYADEYYTCRSKTALDGVSDDNVVLVGGAPIGMLNNTAFYWGIPPSGFSFINLDTKETTDSYSYDVLHAFNDGYYIRALAMGVEDYYLLKIDFDFNVIDNTLVNINNMSESNVVIYNKNGFVTYTNYQSGSNYCVDAIFIGLDGIVKDYNLRCGPNPLTIVPIYSNESVAVFAEGYNSDNGSIAVHVVGVNGSIINEYIYDFGIFTSRHTNGIYADGYVYYLLDIYSSSGTEYISIYKTNLVSGDTEAIYNLPTPSSSYNLSNIVLTTNNTIAFTYNSDTLTNSSSTLYEIGLDGTEVATTSINTNVPIMCAGDVSGNVYVAYGNVLTSPSTYYVVTYDSNTHSVSSTYSTQVSVGNGLVSSNPAIVGSYFVFPYGTQL